MNIGSRENLADENVVNPYDYMILGSLCEPTMLAEVRHAAPGVDSLHLY